jgi:hypothetical protein
MSDYMNLEISKRNIPSAPIQPYLSFHPVSTKYEILPVFNIRKESGVELEQKCSYNTNLIFNPGNRKPPSWCDYVNTESELRNQIYGLSKGSQRVYVPSSNSDLYFYRFNSGNNNDLQQHPLLFRTEVFESFNPNKNNLGNQLFNNNTRVQLKQMNK